MQQHKPGDNYGYTWGGHPCVRCNKSFEGESHPCYYCGTSLLTSDNLDEGVAICYNCGFAICPKCGYCWCNTPENVKQALRYLRDRYCCTPDYFNHGFIPGVEQDAIQLIPYFKKALDYCRVREGVL